MRSLLVPVNSWRCMDFRLQKAGKYHGGMREGFGRMKAEQSGSMKAEVCGTMKAEVFAE